MMRQRICLTLNTIAFVLFTVISGIIAAVILLSQEGYMCKTSFLVPNWGLLVVGVLLAVAFCLVVRMKPSFGSKGNIHIASLILFVVQSYIFYNIFFTTKWDVDIVLRNAQRIATGQGAEPDHYYFSNYPYNQLIIFLFAVCYKVNSVIGIWQEAVFFIVLVQCGLSTLTGKILFQVVRDLVKTESFAWLAWGIYVFLIAVSGWNVIPYTDMMGLIFPISILRIYQTIDGTKHDYWKWFGICLLSFWGYRVKGHVIVVVMALLIVETLHLIQEFHKGKLKKGGLVLAIACMTVLLSLKAESVILEHLGFEIDQEAGLGITHMLMLGLNEKSNGVHSESDVEFSQMFMLKEIRTKEEVKVIKQRLSDYGFGGLLKHMQKKTLTNFNDGTFAWGHEGNFFHHTFEDKNQVVSPFLKKIYYTDGAYYGIYATVCQMIWLVVLMLPLGVIGLKRDKVNSVLVISLLGVMLFVSLFEARARYLIAYVPFWVITSCLVLYRMYELATVKDEEFSENLDLPPEM